MPATRSAEETLRAAESRTDNASTAALVGIGLALLEQVNEARTQTLVAYLQALLMHPHPDSTTASQIEAIASVLERRLGLVPPEAGS